MASARNSRKQPLIDYTHRRRPRPQKQESESDNESIHPATFFHRSGPIKRNQQTAKITSVDVSRRKGKDPIRGENTTEDDTIDTLNLPSKQRPFSTSRSKLKQPPKPASSQRSTTMTDSSIVCDSAGGHESLLDESDIDLRPPKRRPRSTASSPKPVSSPSNATSNVEGSAEEMDLATWLARNNKYLKKFGLRVVPLNPETPNNLKRKRSPISSVPNSENSRIEVEKNLVPFDSPIRARSPSTLLPPSSRDDPVQSPMSPARPLLYALSPSPMSIDPPGPSTSRSQQFGSVPSPTESRSSITLLNVEIPSVSTLMQDPEWRSLRERYLASLAVSAGRGKGKGKGKGKFVEEPEDVVDAVRRRRGLRHIKEVSEEHLHHWDEDYYDKHIPEEFLDEVEDYMDNPHPDSDIVPESEDSGRTGSLDPSDSEIEWVPVSNPYITVSDTEKISINSNSCKLKRYATGFPRKPRRHLEWRNNEYLHQSDDDRSDSEYNLHEKSWGGKSKEDAESGGVMRWCHMCHRKRIAMSCRLCPKPFCDSCLAKYPLPFDPNSQLSRCPVCSNRCICLACKRKRNEEKGNHVESSAKPRSRKLLRRQPADAEQDAEQVSAATDVPAPSARGNLVTPSSTAGREKRAVVEKQCDSTSSPLTSLRSSEEPKSSDPGSVPIGQPMDITPSNDPPKMPAQPTSEPDQTMDGPAFDSSFQQDDLAAYIHDAGDVSTDMVDNNSFQLSQNRIGQDDDLPKWPFPYPQPLPPSDIHTMLKRDSLGVEDRFSGEPYDPYCGGGILGENEPAPTIGIRPDALLLDNSPMQEWGGAIPTDGAAFHYPRDPYREPHEWTPSTVHTEDRQSVRLTSASMEPLDFKAGNGDRLDNDTVGRAIAAALGEFWPMTQ
ncbi:hypothetical protein FRC03_008642 [Tulasnella sp. 419]|nr:hypothetical protein FRC03_008642 [Tulasnella sp. 419]